MKNELTFGTIGTALGIVGTATQTNELLETVSLVITIIGALISFIIVPLLNWHSKAKKDGKITSDEIQEAARIAAQGIEEAECQIEKEKEEKAKDE